MKTCKDCIYHKRCVPTDTTLDTCCEVENYCKDFSDVSEWLHKPCNIGDTVYSLVSKGNEPAEIAQGVVKNILFDNSTESLKIIAQFHTSPFIATTKASFKDYDFGRAVFLNRETVERLKRKEVSKNVY